MTLPGIYVLLSWTAGAVTRARPPRQALAVLLMLCTLAALATGARRQLGFWRDGESLSRRALAVTRDNWVAMVNLGTTLLEGGDPAGALALYRQAAAIRPDEGTAYANAGLALARLERHEEAATAFERAWFLGFREPRAETARGASLLALGRVAEAEAAFRRALALDPGDAAAREGLAAATASPAAAR
jgi:Flp pilus assembly protein TadD